MIRFHRQRTVTGAAHTNWSMFGARGPCLAPEDPPGGSPAPTPSPGGDPPAPAPNPAPTPSPADVVFTPEQQAVINKLVGQARQEGRNAAQAAKPPAPAPAPAPAPQPEPKMTLESLAQRLAETELRARFDKRALKRGYDDDAADDLFELYKVQKPTDDEQWFAEREKRLGLKPVTTATPPATQPPTTLVAPTVPNTAPISDRGAPTPNGVNGWQYELSTNPMNMSPGNKAAMNLELGEEVARKRRLAAAQAQAQRMTVVINPRG